MPAELMVEPTSSIGALPLAGFTIGVTADRRADEQIQLLERKGATIVHGPTIRTHPLGDESGLAAATRSLIDDPPDIAVFITALGVRSWLEAAEALGLADALLDVLERCALWTRGPKASGAIAALGLSVTSSVSSRSAEVCDALLAHGVAGKRIAVQLDGAGNEPMLARLEAAGADVVSVPVYRWTLPDDIEPAQRLVRSIVEGRIDAVTFTTRTAIVHLLAIADGLGLHDDTLTALNRTTVAVCVGPVCAELGRSVGISGMIEPRRARLGSMVLDFANKMGGEVTELRIGGVMLRVQGRLVQVDDDEPVSLTWREREVLQILVDAGGRVVAKGELLRRVWGPRERNAHLVEVTIGRLRQRLGAASDAVETIYRRGYRISV